MAYDPTIIDSLLLRIIESAEDTLAVKSVPVTRSGIVLGDLVSDIGYDCPESQLVARVVSVAPLRQKPTPCSPVMAAVTAGLSVLRCTTAIDADDVSVSPEVLTEEAIIAGNDMAALARVLISDTFEDFDISLLQWIPGNEGGSGGGEWQFTFVAPICKGSC